MKGEKINSYIDGRGFIIISSLIAFTLAIITLISNITINERIFDYGLFANSANMWLDKGTLSWSINLVTIIAIAIVITVCNNQFQFIRSFTSLLATIFVILATCNTHISNTLIDGNILALVTIISVSLLYFTFQYGNPVILFSIFTLIITCSFFNYAYLTLLPIFILGAMQMKAINTKTVLAIVLGIIIPFWIIYGLHIFSPSDIKSINMVSIARAVVIADSPIFIYNLTTAVITFFLLIKNMITIYNFPPQERAYNGVLTLLTLWSIVMPMIDYYNSNSYMPTLYLCCAVQGAHAYTSSRDRYKYLWVITLILAYLSLYIWQLL
ncbi:MAG: hypothetical protein R3Y22_04920 [Bacteroidales bacterium]